MTDTIYDVLDRLRATAMSEADKGSKFERLMKAFLQTDPLYAEQFKDVWLWSEWPGNGGKHDTGIDLVAYSRVAEGHVAIQCKFYADTAVISKEDIDTFMSASGKEGFIERIIVSTTDRWGRNAEDAIKGQQIPVRRIGMADLEASPIDWGQFSIETPEVMVTVGPKTLRPHQTDAIQAATAGFVDADRGKLIMACGTGKTFTSLQLAEQMVGAGGSVLFLVPSISLLSQTLREWSNEAGIPLRSLAVCSDAKSSARSKNNDEDIAAVDLALPATTNLPVLVERLQTAELAVDSMTVVFSTYQSIDVVAKAQAASGATPFDLIICDEAHRTTGVTLAEEDESPFVRVHDANYIQGIKRLYMTATPRLYDDAAKAKAGEAAAVLASMDDEAVFGREFYRLGFGAAVAQGLLSDYKVLVLAVDGKTVATTFQAQLADKSGELALDDVAKIVGCWNGLAKRGQAEHGFAADPAPMRRAVAFAGTIKASKKVEDLFDGIVDQYVVHETDEDGEAVSVLDCEVKHVDGTFNALERNTKLDWLRGEVADGKCRILTNARCLSEGVDVPALDAVMFLSPRKSIVDVVQSVGRVMRRAPGKKYGYIILPIAIPEGEKPEEALRNNARYQVVWDVLQALRAHDDRLNAEINKIDLTHKRSDRINVIGVGGGERASSRRGVQGTLALNLQHLDEWRDAIYTRIVQKVGSRRYWEDWAKDVADIAQSHITRIVALLDTNRGGVADAFEKFIEGLRGNLNDGITRADAVEMLAQHLITRPVFEALFAGNDFAARNPVAQTMERMLATLDEQSLDSENATLEKFYESVRMRAQGIDNPAGRQRIIVELYETFFSTAFKRTVDKLGIVYTPVEIVDFILHSADQVLRAEFGQGLTDEGVHILDGFTGTGTFMVRLIQSGLINTQDLARKYANELHANEILLLAYYIAAVNIEYAYHDAVKNAVAELSYQEFPGLILADTFQSWENDDRLDYEVFRENNSRLERLKSLPIRVIVGNPPYSAGQDSANDANANEAYPTLDEAIRTTYAARSSATNKNSLYDSYIRAIKWASQRVTDRGVIAYVSNGGWIDSNTADGMRMSLADEFSSIYVYNLRGNQRTAGEQSRREGGKIFGGGSRATVAITVLVKNPEARGRVVVKYAEIGDYLSREQKLEKISAAGGVDGVEFTAITPNEHGDWVNQRREDFEKFIGVAEIFGLYSGGLKTNRDAWCYNFDADALAANMGRLIGTYEGERAAGRTSNNATTDPMLISWNRGLLSDLDRKRKRVFRASALRKAVYRPFVKEHVYFDRALNDMVYRLESLHPTETVQNRAIFFPNPGSMAPTFMALAVDQLIDNGATGSSGANEFARWRYEPIPTTDQLAFGDNEEVGGYRQIDNITEESFKEFAAAYGPKITKDDVFHYVYGLLHSGEYRATYAADLRKMLPRIPLVDDCWPFVEAGRDLTELHIGYEAATPYALEGLDVPPVGNPYEFYRVEKMTFAKVRDAGKLILDKSTIRVSPRVSLSGIPDDAHRFMLGSRSAIEWIIDRYQVKKDKASGIVNDPNDWSREVGNPRYILDLLARIVTVSVETMKIVDSLPTLAIRPHAR